MMITLMLSASLYSPAAPPENSLPRFVELKPDEDGKVRVDVMRPRRDFETKAQIIVLMRRTESRPNSGAMSNQEFVATQMEFMRSYAIVSVAAKRIETAKLELPPKGNDFFAYVRRGLRISPHRDAETGTVTNVVDLSFNCPNRDDCLKVLTAYIDAYRDSISGGRNVENDVTLRQIEFGIKKAEEDLERHLKEHRTLRERLSETSVVSLAELRSKISSTTSETTVLYQERIDLEGAKSFAEEAMADG